MIIATPGIASSRAVHTAIESRSGAAAGATGRFPAAPRDPPMSRRTVRKRLNRLQLCPCAEPSGRGASYAAELIVRPFRVPARSDPQ